MPRSIRLHETMNFARNLGFLHSKYTKGIRRTGPLVRVFRRDGWLECCYDLLKVVLEVTEAESFGASNRILRCPLLETDRKPHWCILNVAYSEISIHMGVSENALHTLFQTMGSGFWRVSQALFRWLTFIVWLNYGQNHTLTYGGFLQLGVPRNHPFQWDFPLWTNHLGVPPLMETPILTGDCCMFQGNYFSSHENDRTTGDDPTCRIVFFPHVTFNKHAMNIKLMEEIDTYNRIRWNQMECNTTIYIYT